MNCRGDSAPALNLAFAKEAGSVDESNRARAYPRPFREDETGCRPLPIIFDMKVGGRKLCIARTSACRGGHHHAISMLKVAKRAGVNIGC